jgi:hypothetical protein
MNCHHCKTEMVDSTATGQTYVSYPDFPDDSIRTLSPGGPGYRMPCLKCPQCVWSVTKPEQESRK